MSSTIYFETFAAAVDGARADAEQIRATLKPTEDLASLTREPLFYEQTRQGDFELDFFRGKPTRKFFHVSIYRLDSGRYELTTYVL
jgi:hypothetical protein